MPLSLLAPKTGATMRLLSSCALLVALAGCMSVPLTPTSYTPASAQSAKPLQLTRPVTVLLRNQTSVPLAAGSLWVAAGSIPQGQVYRKSNGSLIVEGRRTREAYLAVADGRLTGLYFPGESAFTPVALSTSISLEQLP